MPANVAGRSKDIGGFFTCVVVHLLYMYYTLAGHTINQVGAYVSGIIMTYYGAAITAAPTPAFSSN